MRRYTFGVLVALLVAMPGHESLRAGAALYTVENLGTAAGLVPTVTGMNASGQVAGFVNGPAGARAVRYTNGVGWEYLPGLDTSFSVATGINDSGDLVGYHMAPTGLRAFRYRNGTGVEDIAPVAGGSMTFGFGINSASDVVGYSVGGTGVGFVAHLGMPAVELPSLGGSDSMACGVNDAGQIAGYSTTAAGVQHAVRIDPGQPVIDISSFDGAAGTSTGCAIDAAGRVGGQAASGGVLRAFRFLSGSLANLDTFASTQSNTESIAKGTSVGWFTTPTGRLRAFVHTDADGSTDLNGQLDGGTGWVLAQAKAINTDGAIAGEGTFNGAPAVFRLTRSTPPPDTTAPVIGSLAASPSSVYPPNHMMVPVVISASATDDTDPSPVCSISSIDGHGAAGSSMSITGPLTGAVRADGGALYSFLVSCADAAGNAATGSVDVVVPRDTTPPVFTRLTATPSVVVPPAGQTVAITIAAAGTDDSGEPPTCKLGNITGPGTAPTDFNVTGANTGTVRAVGGRTYTFNALCVDSSNNVAWASVPVVVPADTTAPVISQLSATPSSIWPPNGKMVPVSVFASATDNVDPSPRCSLTSIGGAPASDWAITGPLSALVRADKGDSPSRAYELQVSCQDASGNSSEGSVSVLVTKDQPQAAKANNKK